MKINKNKAWGFLFFGITIFAFIMMYETDFSSSLGDRFLNAVGLKAWSHGNSGLHNTFFLFILLVLAGYLGIKYFWEDEYPKIAKRMPVLIILLLLFTHPVITAANGVIKSYADGLHAIEYIAEGSEGNYRTNEDGTPMRFDCSIRVKNHGREELEFYIRYFPSEHIRENYVDGEYATAMDENGKPRRFILGPKSETVLYPVFEMKQKPGVRGGTIGTTRLSIALFNDRQTIEFRYRNDKF